MQQYIIHLSLESSQNYLEHLNHTQSYKQVDFTTSGGGKPCVSIILTVIFFREGSNEVKFHWLL